MVTTIGLVVEGKDDIPIIQAIIRGEFSKIGLTDVEFRQLQPQTDATGAIERGGWSKVIGWLSANSSSRITTFFEPVFEGDDACNALVVHMDADIYRDCLAHLDELLPSEPVKPADLVNTLRSALQKVSNLSDYHRKLVAYAVPVYKTENWIMAAIPACADEHWTSLDAKSEIKKVRRNLAFASMKSLKETAMSSFEAGTAAIDRAKSYKLFQKELGEVANALSSK